MNINVQEAGNNPVKLWHAIITMAPILFIIISVGYSYASGVDQNTNDVKNLKSDVKKLSEVKVDINTLNVTTATLKNDVEHIKASQQQTKEEIRETNKLLRELIIESKERNKKDQRHWFSCKPFGSHRRL